MTKTIFNWATHKTEAGTFEAVVCKSVTRDTPNANGFYADRTELKRVPCKTRAIAKSHAQKWVRYFKANPDAA